MPEYSVQVPAKFCFDYIKASIIFGLFNMVAFFMMLSIYQRVLALPDSVSKAKVMCYCNLQFLAMR